MLSDIRHGLGRPQKELPTRLFYDERGSELFEEITRLPEYYPTRAELELITEHAPRWIANLQPRTLIELGAGSATKTRVFLDALQELGSGATYVPVDISADFLERTADALRTEYPQLTVSPIAARFTRSLGMMSALPRPALITFLGSTIGNLTTSEAVDLLRQVRAAMQPGDRFALGVDMRKDVSILEAAYNDSRGTTAEFNLNMLHVINRRFGADFDVQSFRHRAVYNSDEHRIEMHLVSTRPQSVTIPGIDPIRLREGETIRTEISCKYDRASISDMYRAAELRLLEWQQGEDGLFALSLAEAA